MLRFFSFFLMMMAILVSTGCVETVTAIHERSEGDKALYLRHDPVEAYGHYQKAAQGGDAKAQHELAMMYLTGEGVSKNIVQFQKMEEKAAAQGYPPAMRNLGFMLVAGLEGLQPEPQRGMSLLKAAAEEDDASAHYMLGGIYSRGAPGVQRNCSKGAYHYALAEENGIPVTPEMKNAAALEAMGLQPLALQPSSSPSPVASNQDGAKYDLAALKTKQYVQYALKNLGYYSMKIDGIIGKGSAKAIKAFQSDSGLKLTGRIDEQLVDALRIALRANKK